MSALRCVRWFVIFHIVAAAAHLATARPQESPSSPSPNRSTTKPIEVPVLNQKKDDKTNITAIGESIKMVATQLLQGNNKPPPTTGEGVMIDDVRTPPKVKNQQVIKNKVKATVTTSTVKPTPTIENSHAGMALPLTPEDLEKENLHTAKNNSAPNKESSTTNEGISTWILLSESPTTTQKNPNKPTTVYDKPKTEESKRETTPRTTPKPKPKVTTKATPKPTTQAPKPLFSRRPIAIGSSNKADLIASGSAVNENVMNKIKASVLANVQKNKNAAMNKTTTTTTTTTTVTSTAKPTPTTPVVRVTQPVTKSEVTTLKAPKRPQVVKTKKNSNKLTTTEKNSIDLGNGVESKHAEIELEVSTPSTVKKPKRTSSKRKKNKNRRRKNPTRTTTTKPDMTVAESKISDKTEKTTKVENKVETKEKPITTQLYNYLSREVMPSVGVGLVSLAGLVGLASYLFYPFSGVVRRAYDPNERKDDFYSQNGEIYASNDGGHSEVEMLDEVYGTGPSKKTDKINSYIKQQQSFRYPEQNVRYRNVAFSSDANSYLPSNRVGQQNNDAQGATYSEQIHYDTHTDDQFGSYQPQPVYKSSENIVDTNYPEPTHPGYVFNDREPIYGQPMGYGQDLNSDPTSSPAMETLHLGADDVIEKQKETGYTVAAAGMDDKEPQFVVGNVPKELIQAVTPATVPEHGPRSLRIRRAAIDIATNIEAFLKEARENSTDPELSNEIDEALGVTKKVTIIEAISYPQTTPKSVSIKEIENYLTTKKVKLEESTTTKGMSSNEILINKIMEPLKVEIVGEENVTTEKSQSHVFVEVTTKMHEDRPTESGGESESKPNEASENKPETDQKPEMHSSTPPSYYNTDEPEDVEITTDAPRPFDFIRFIKNLIEFKIRLGVHLIQSTSESLARYFRSVSRASEHYNHSYH